MRVVYTVFTTVFTVFTYGGVFTTVFTIVYTVFTYEGVYTVFTYEGVYTVFTIVLRINTFAYNGICVNLRTLFCACGICANGICAIVPYPNKLRFQIFMNLRQSIYHLPDIILFDL